MQWNRETQVGRPEKAVGQQLTCVQLRLCHVIANFWFQEVKEEKLSELCPRVSFVFPVLASSALQFVQAQEGSNPEGIQCNKHTAGFYWPVLGWVWFLADTLGKR